MPWSKFPKGGKHFAHTILTDFLDFKHIFGITKSNEHHFYYPSNATNWSKQWVDGHYITQFNAMEHKASYLAKYQEHVGILGSLSIALGLGGAIYETTQGEDPTNTLALSLSTFNDAGLILDPDYQYDDDAPPSFGIDWGIYKGLQPVKNTLLDNTPWGRERKKENEEIRAITEGNRIVKDHPLANDSSVQADKNPNKKIKDFKNDAGQDCFYIGDKLYCEGG